MLENQKPEARMGMIVRYKKVTPEVLISHIYRITYTYGMYK